jgi:hypothetical protein
MRTQPGYWEVLAKAGENEEDDSLLKTKKPVPVPSFEKEIEIPPLQTEI